MSEEKQNSIVGRLWTSKDDDGNTKGYSGSLNPELLSSFEADQYGNVRVWVSKNKNKRSGKKDCDLFISAFTGEARSAGKPAYKGKPAYAKKAPPAAPKKAAPVEEAEGDDDFLD